MTPIFQQISKHQNKRTWFQLRVFLSVRTFNDFLLISSGPLSETFPPFLLGGSTSGFDYNLIPTRKLRYFSPIKRGSQASLCLTLG